MAFSRWFFLLGLIPAIAFGDEPKPAELAVGSKFAATDTLACSDETSADAKECLAGLSWTPGNFDVRVEPAARGCGDFMVRFDSPQPIGNAANDLVAMEWYAARDDANAIKKAPAIVVVHESGNQMTVGRLIARSLSGQGLHAFLIHMPGYGVRRFAGREPYDRSISLQQAIADARRARDAVVALPVVDHSVVGLQGTSLGGFVTATVAGLDHGYDRVFIVLAGGDLQHVVLHGAKDAAKVREKLAAAGVSEDQMKELARQVEPLRLAHRINPAGTWIFNGKFDDVVPPECSSALAKAAHLADDHHLVFPADHYSGIVYMPQVVGQIYQQMVGPHETTQAKEAAPAAQ